MKSKVAAKTGGAKYQWEIMRSIGLEDEEIRKYVLLKVIEISFSSRFVCSIFVVRWLIFVLSYYFTIGCILFGKMYLNSPDLQTPAIG